MASALALQLGLKTKVALAVAALSDMKDSIRRWAKALLSDELVDDKEGSLLELVFIMSAAVWHRLQYT
jgi:hypothetical protein